MDFYQIKKESYDAIAESIKEGFQPKSGFQIPIVLPFYIPVKDNGEFVKTADNYSIIFKFKKLDYERTVHDDSPAMKILFPSEVKSLTYLEMLFISPEDYLLDEPTFTTKVMNTLLIEINRLIVGFSLQTLNPGIYRVTRQMFNKITICRPFYLEQWNPEMVAVMPINNSDETDYYGKNVLTDEEFEKVDEQIYYSVSLFKTSELFAFDSLKNFTIGFANESVINVQTSMESFLSTLLIRKLMIDGSSYEDSASFVDKLAFRNLINPDHSHLSFLTGLDWNIKDGSSKCKKWFDTTYNLRNKIVHRGYEPSYFEAQEAIRNALEFREEIFKVIITLEGQYEMLAKEANKFYMRNPETYAFRILKSNVSFNPEVVQRAVQLANLELMRRKLVDFSQENSKDS